ncbi:DUF1566 domain-containing protein [Desulfobulbus sp. TB]|nr:DUF1566 domain-containing protein [Desulfobulbus sp. TB]
MQILCIILCCIFSAVTVHATQNCKTDSIPASTPNSQLIDNGNGTITDLKTGLMWKQCLEGVSGSSCETGSPDFFTWQEALQRPGLVNNAGGFAGYTDWRLSNVKELISIVEEQCTYPTINLARFPNTPSSFVWSGSPFAVFSDSAWYVNFRYGDSGAYFRNANYAVRLVRGGQ